MFTIDQINEAHSKVKSGVDFPQFIRDLKKLGVKGFETYVVDGHSIYWGDDIDKLISEPMYSPLTISESNFSLSTFRSSLIVHQKGYNDYYTFCKSSATCGVFKWVVDINSMTCIYLDKGGRRIFSEMIFI